MPILGVKQLIARPIQIPPRKFTKAYRHEKVMVPAEYSEVRSSEDCLTVVIACASDGALHHEDLSPHVSSARLAASPGLAEEDDDHIEISKELFLTVVQDGL